MTTQVKIRVDHEGCAIDPGGGALPLRFDWSCLRLVGRFSDRQDDFPGYRGLLLVLDRGGVYRPGAIEIAWLVWDYCDDLVALLSHWWRVSGGDGRRERACLLRQRPGHRLHVDPQLMSELLSGRPIAHWIAPGVRDSDRSGWLHGDAPFPDWFLCRPAESEGELHVRWPEQIGSARCNSQDERRATYARALVAGSRPGSRFADCGQTRTAAVFESADGGASWQELPLRLPWWQQLLPRGSFNWPPEQIDGIRVERGRPTIYFEDPWIPFELGCEWKASWDDARRYWVMIKLRYA